MNHVLAIIPARGGSKGVPRKNIRNLAGKPLIAWTIEAAKQSKYIDRLVLSSEDEEIIDVAKEYGCEVPFLRPKELAEDTTPGIAPVLHAISILQGYEYVLLLQPTSPLRSTVDIDSAFEFILKSDANACVSVTETSKSPYWSYQLDKKNRLVNLLPVETIARRQDLPKTFNLNGAIYIAKVKWLLENETFLTDETIAYKMPKNRSYDIDDEEDFLWCEFLISHFIK